MKLMRIIYGLRSIFSNKISRLIVLAAFILSSCFRNEKSFLNKSEVNNIVNYASQTFGINPYKMDSCLLIIVRISDCDCVDFTFKTALKFSSLDPFTIVISDFGKDFERHRWFLQESRSDQVFFDFSRQYEKFQLATFSTLLIKFKGGGLSYASVVDVSTIDEIDYEVHED